MFFSVSVLDSQFLPVRINARPMLLVDVHERLMPGVHSHTQGSFTEQQRLRTSRCLSSYPEQPKDNVNPHRPVKAMQHLPDSIRGLSDPASVMFDSTSEFGFYRSCEVGSYALIQYYFSHNKHSSLVAALPKSLIYTQYISSSWLYSVFTDLLLLFILKCYL